ncbi:hypothetical protein [Ktedonobacter sp. SOSP1-52]|uniref:hypothetical protein n=1 Tax=Ktedonobacter sp. SOSP1-52 TaxID=2778366 RepID=UPI001F233266|nr:hypothetical protein [Ktedonobacter sp. SOSP1-52]
MGHHPPRLSTAQNVQDAIDNLLPLNFGWSTFGRRLGDQGLKNGPLGVGDITRDTLVDSGGNASLWLLLLAQLVATISFLFFLGDFSISKQFLSGSEHYYSA